MSTADGFSLQQLIDASLRLDELGTARLMADAAELVHKAQQAGQPLGTLSPTAIRVQRSGQVCLVPGASVLAYSAPERLRGSTGDRRSDVFSLGVLLWEALAHAPLFDGASDDAIKISVLAGELRPPSEMNANIPAELDAICKKALARDPVDRYQSARVMAAELSAVLDEAGYPEDNAGIAQYLEALAIAARVPRPPVLPADPPAVRPGTQTMLGVSPIREIDAAIAAQPAETRAKTPTEPPAAETRARTPTEPTRAKTPTEPPAAETRARTPTEPPRAKTPTEPPRARTPTEPPRARTPTEPPRAKTPTAPPPAEPPAASTRAKTPTAPGPLPSWATARPGSTEPPPISSPDPASTLPGMLARAPDPAAAKPDPRQTAILGSVSSAELEPIVPAPGQPASGPVGRKTEVHGSNSLAEKLAALNAPAATEPSLAAADEPIALTDVKAEPIALTNVKPAIANAETIATPALAASSADATAVPALASQLQTAEPSPAATAVAVDAAAAAAMPHPASVVALPRARSRSEGGVVKGDLLAGWGWGTGPHDAVSGELDEDVYEDDRRVGKKRLYLAMGGAAGAVLLIVAIAMAFGGGGDPQAQVSAKQAEPAVDAVDWSAPTDPPPPEPAAVEPVAPDPALTEGVPVEPAAVAAEPEPVAPAPAEVIAPAPAEVIAPEPAKVAPEPVKVAAEPRKPEPRKPEPRKPEPRKPEPKQQASWDPLAVKPAVKAPEKRPEKKPRTTGAKPIDPYAEPRPNRVDANAAYRTGIQQFARGDSAGALTTFKASIAANPRFAPTWRGIGMVYEKLGKKSQAKTAFRRYLQLSPSAGDAPQIRERLERL